MLQRIARMGPHEVYTRLRQRAAGHADEVRHQLGLAPSQPASSNRAPASVFFFDPGTAGRIARAWAVRHPSAVRRTIEHAGSIAAHRFSLLGYRDLDFGSPIDWHRDPVHGIRAPMVAWRRVPYLDFRRVGDHKIVWELSRHQQLTTLIRARLFTGDGRWIDEAVAQWHDWQRANLYGAGRSPSAGGRWLRRRAGTRRFPACDA